MTPKETFLHLDAEKQERIIEAAARTFAERGFSRTDMAQIARAAGVAKGSLYNYFSSKEDLYVYICRDGLERSREAVYHELDPTWDIYRQLEHIFSRGMSFALAHPAYVRLYLNISTSGMESFAEQLTLEVERHTAHHLKTVLRDNIARGLVRPDLDVPLTAFLINSIYVIFLVSFVSRHYQLRLQEYLELDGDQLDRFTIEERLQRVVEIIGQLLRPLPEEKKT